MSENAQQADIKTVVKDLEDVVEKNPKNVMAHHQLGLVYRKVGRVEDAIRELERALELALPAPGQAEYLDLLRAISRLEKTEEKQREVLSHIREFALQKQPDPRP